MSNNISLVLGKSESEISNALRESLNKWCDILNSVIGIISFSFGLACLGTGKHSQCYATISLLFVLLIITSQRKLFPSELKILRAKKNKNKLEKKVLHDIEKEFLVFSPYFQECLFIG